MGKLILSIVVIAIGLMLLKTRKSLQKTDSVKPGAGYGAIAAGLSLFGALLTLFGMLGIVSSFVYMVPTQ